MMRKHAQIILEYILVIGVITGVMIVMSTALKRSVQGMVKAVADQVGFQENSEQQDQMSGHMENYVSTVQREAQTAVRERLGNTTYMYLKDGERTQTELVTNMGYTEDD